MKIIARILVTGLLVGLSLTAQDGPAQAPATTKESAPVPAAGDPLYAPVATSASAQSAHDAFMDYALVTFGPRAVFTPLISAGFRMLNPPSRYPHEWKDGAGAFGRNYGNSLAARTALHTARYGVATLLHEDFRYRPSGAGNPVQRTFHALAFTFVDRSEAGNPRLAIANFAGAAASGFVGNSYLPPGYDNVSHAGTRTATAFAGLAGQNLLREFAPDLARLTRKLHLPFPKVPIPEWWVKR